MPTPVPKKSNFVAIGAWNPAIIQPNWLKEQFPSLVPDNIPLRVSLGGAPSLVLDLGLFLLDPNGGRVIITPKTFEEETWSLISKLMGGISQKLEHTPISAAGCNFAFHLDEDEKFEIEEPIYASDADESYSKMGLKNCIEHTVLHTFSFENYNLNLTFVSNDKEQMLFINYNYQSPVNAIVLALDGLLENYHGASELCSKLIIRNGS